MQTYHTQYKDLVLLGGGHSHALVLKMWAMRPLPGVRVTLISPNAQTPYSGMLPGLISGHYSFDATHIDLVRVCKYANVRFIQAAATGVDFRRKEILFLDRPPLGFDVLSIDTGITPDLSIPGSELHTTPVKPIAEFYPRWQSLVAHLSNTDTLKPQHIAVVGGGAAGVELILAMQHSLNSNSSISLPLNFHLIQNGKGLPENYPVRLQRKMAALFSNRNIRIHEECAVVKVTPNNIETASGELIYADAVFWCTQAKTSEWPKASGLEVNERGFIAINDCLQSISHDFVFAAGDIAKQVNNPRPNAGVYAVRQAPTLFHNLRAYLLQEKLIEHQPQTSFLSLLACGNKHAMGCRPGTLFPTMTGEWVWKWKDHIDRKFMAQFSELPPSRTMKPVTETSISPALINGIADNTSMRCGGCGAKVGSSILQKVINRLEPFEGDNVVLGLSDADDAAAISVPSEQCLVQSVDVFKGLVDDPYLQGKIAAEHALSDLFAMNAAPNSALALVTLPYANENIVERDLFQLMSGAVDVFNQHNCTLLGGHTSEGSELSIGFSVNGFAPKTQLLRKNQAQTGNKLILTQGLGTGVLFAASAQCQAHGNWIVSATQAMQLSNKNAAKILEQSGATACTDITGFGLLGHLLEILKHSDVGAELALNTIPLLDGALECSQQGIVSSLYSQNSKAKSILTNLENFSEDQILPILFDPQTSGGLLASVPIDKALRCIEKLHQAGYKAATIIGEIKDTSGVNLS